MFHLQIIHFSKTFKKILHILFLISLSFTSINFCYALTPKQVVVIANKKAWYSCKLAKYYMEKRNIPPNNLIKLKAPTEENCTRKDYEKWIASPIRTYLGKNDPEGIKFKCLVIMYGIPLRINPPELTDEEQMRLKKLQKNRDSILEKTKEAKSQNDKQALKSLKEEGEKIKDQIEHASKILYRASVDSELALVREVSYPLEGWLPNGYFLGYRGKKTKNMLQKLLLVSRLDGPSEEIVRRIIDDSLYIEKKGLEGIAYFDARWPDPGDKEVSGYQLFDRALYRAANLLNETQRMPSKIDSHEELFQPGDCPDAAIYCGWYSLGRYIDAFSWAKGAVGYHMASGECSTLKRKDSRVWCKVMLEKGVTATIGPVVEPYIQAFPAPDIFFGSLIKGSLTLAECYALSNPFWSWQMVLIGDPLYCPFKSRCLK